MAERLERHPLSVLCEDMPSEEYQKLVESVRQDGVIDYVIKTLEHEGEPHVLDGFHRYSAAHDAGETDGLIITPYTGNDPVSYVRAKNLRRRHLTLGQRASIEVALSEWAVSGSPPNLIQGDSTGETISPHNTGRINSDAATVAEMAEDAGVSERLIQQAKVAEEAGLGDVVRSGELPVHKAAAQAKGEPEAPKPPTKVQRLEAERDAARMDVQEKAEEKEGLERALREARAQMSEYPHEREKVAAEREAIISTLRSQLNEYMVRANEDSQSLRYWKREAKQPCRKCGTEWEFTND